MKNESIFKKIINLISLKSPLQKKKIERYLPMKDKLYWEEFEIFAKEYNDFLINNGLSLEYAVDAYLKMCKDMLNSQIYFLKTGNYPVTSSEDFVEKVYNNENEMTSYMIGLAISQFLWNTHYEIFSLFKSFIKERKYSVNSYLEIGPGHGLYLKNAIRILSENTKFTAVDISPVSMKITKAIIENAYPDSLKRISFYVSDFSSLKTDEKFDFIMMGEIIEHVAFPDKLLKKAIQLLNKNGIIFLSTCVNCPAIDHVYHFKTVKDIHITFEKLHMKIIKELILPVEDLPIEEIINKKITINYCAILQGG